jgi:hypothetical protein
MLQLEKPIEFQNKNSPIAAEEAGVGISYQAMGTIRGGRVCRDGDGRQGGGAPTCPVLPSCTANLLWKTHLAGCHSVTSLSPR